MDISRRQFGGRGSAEGGAKKLVIKPFKVQPKIPENFVRDTWDKLRQALGAVYSSDSSAMSKEELYRAVEDLCLQKQAGPLFSLLCRECSGHISRKVDALGSASAALAGQPGQLLAAVDRIWTAHCEQLSTVRNIFLYLDRSYALTNQGSTLAAYPAFAQQEFQQPQQTHSSPSSITAANSGSNSATPDSLPVTQVHLIIEFGHLVFRKQLLDKPELLTSLVASVLHAVDSFRRGSITAIESDYLAHTCHMMQTLSLYLSHLEQPLLLDAKRFFTAEGVRLSAECAPTAFLVAAERRLHEAGDMCVHFFCAATKKPLVECVEQTMLLPHLQCVVDRGLAGMLDNTDASARRLDLSRIYRLFERVKGLQVLNTGWVAYIKSTGARIMKETQPQQPPAPSTAAATAASASPNVKPQRTAPPLDTSTVVEAVLVFYEKLESICQTCFSNGGYSSGSSISSLSSEAMFKTSMKSSFAEFLNADRNAAAELLARYVDKKMKPEKGVTEAEAEAALDSVLKLFRHLQEKDVFEAFYKKHLSKRLLLGKSASYELERSMLSKLKTECGANFTAKLEGMFQDMELSRECSTAYQLYQQEKKQKEGSSSSSGGSSGPEMHIEVLTSGFWPTVGGSSTQSGGSGAGAAAGEASTQPAGSDILLPPELTTHMDDFTSFYTTKYQGRRLVWNHALERCVVSAHFPKGKKDLEVSLFQALVLKCFNLNDESGSSSGDGKLTIAQVHGLTGIEMSELRRVLQSLACGMLATRVLLKEPKGRDVGDADVFSANRDFSHKLFRIKINTIQSKETSEEVSQTHEEVFRDREYQVDAVVVRTMKSRKRMAHSELMGEVMAQLRFPARNSDVKKRIESLIERDFLERDENEAGVYNYLA